MKTIRVMVSSRCADQVPFEGKLQQLTVLRRALKKALESETLLGEPLFEVWINEDAPAAEGSSDSWEACLEQVRTADIVLVLYNGNAGWAKDSGGIGICHAEFETCINEAPAKLRVISIPSVDKKVAGEPRNVRFKDYYERQSRFRMSAASGEECIKHARAVLREAVVDMVRLGTREARKGKYYSGAALDWSRLDFSARKLEIESVMRAALLARPGSSDIGEWTIAPLRKRPVLFRINAVPGAMSIASAREMVGQPFTRDHLSNSLLTGDTVGPVHLIGCMKGVSEAQAMALIGVPDVTLVTTPFGIFVADNVQKIQILLVANCRDDTSTRHGLQRAMDWLEQSGEDVLLVGRAESRKRIVKALAKEQAAAK